VSGLREARDRLSTSEYRWVLLLPAAVVSGGDRSAPHAAAERPGFTNRDAVYYYLAESLVRMNRQAEALPYYDRLVKEFDTSEYLERAQKRLQEFQALTPPAEQPAAGTPAEGTPAPPASPAPPETATTTPTSTPPRQ
jgi:hypothetical protein